MSYLTHLKRTKHHHSCRWIVKYDDQNLIREVKLIHNPDEYRAQSGRNLHTINGLIKILENDKSKK